jgi:hypothetical protein
MIKKLMQRLPTGNVRNLPRHKVGFYSFIVVASSAAVILGIFL